MISPPARSPRRLGLRAWHVPALSALVMAAAIVCARVAPRPADWPLALVGLGLLLLVGNVPALGWLERRRWRGPVRLLADQVRALALGKSHAGAFTPPCGPDLDDLARAIDALWGRVADAPGPGSTSDQSWLGPWDPTPPPSPRPPELTRSGLLGPSSSAGAGDPDPSSSGEFPCLDMVNRLEPGGLHWLESTPAEQEFLGWPLPELRRRAFPEIVHPDDRELAREQLHAAVARGEAHGLVYRIRTARGETRAVEMNVSVRYAPDHAPDHLRCHVTDVTAKVKAGRELRRRTRELIRANEELRRINRELEELKDRYGDLYRNAPAMYFSLDEQGRFLECNDTLLKALAHDRDDLIGRPYSTILAPSRHAAFGVGFAEFLQVGFVEFESQWRKSDGGAINVWVTASIVAGPDGSRQSRGVAQDVTARRVLEAELREKNDRLARANAELSRKNKELDEFSYVVSHDLQEPLRTLIAFSDFLQRDCGDRLDDTGKEYVRHIVDASLRMRALVRDLLDLSLSGRATADFAPVDLDEVLALLAADFAALVRDRCGEIRRAGPLPTVWGDRARIGQLFGNLVSNGLKYHPGPGPIVEVGALPDAPDGWATLYVKDNGIGIDPQFHARIFQLFRRLHTREEFEGTGAGLAICQKIVRAHGGTIRVESQPGQGATFFVTLPLIPAPGPGEEPGDNDQTCGVPPDAPGIREQ